MCKFKTGTNTDYNKRAGFNIRICQTKYRFNSFPGSYYTKMQCNVWFSNRVNEVKDEIAAWEID